MKAVVYYEQGTPEVLTIEEVEKPGIKPDEILIRVKAAGLNPVDTYFRSGKRPVSSFPAIPHFDAAGIVEEVGSSAGNFQPGDRVWGTNIPSAAAEWAAAPASNIFPLPDTMSFTEGASLGIPALTAHLALFFRAALQPGETVFIYGGAGAVGHAAIQLAKHHNAFVITTASTNEKNEIARRAGADVVLNLNDNGWKEDFASASGKPGADVILDMSFSENAATDLHILSPGGRIVAVGSPVNNMPAFPWQLLNQKYASILGILLFTAPLPALQKAASGVQQSYEQGLFSPHIARTYPMDEAAQAHEDLENKRYAGNLVLTVSE
ncbi:quinone oxidoreductase [Marinococcus halophilus]|uniref:NADPH:quinone oxidoreductase n=1 Tax=Marinococcus halophilus TaxID=1371 RepID=A0A510YC36_MARHA|nr:NADPH:quinone reductase [Marinococcus halophilus]OZT78809.1 quinone oxidoreductase [Marinococcus halophilus]GEK60211.1 NADPH:quinone oxidoreductase [Marinococcus halophilus]